MSVVWDGSPITGMHIMTHSQTGNMSCPIWERVIAINRRDNTLWKNEVVYVLEYNKEDGEKKVRGFLPSRNRGHLASHHR